MNSTPRTATAAVEIISPLQSGTILVVPIEKARTLELELIAAQSTVLSLQLQNAKMREVLQMWIDWHEDCGGALGAPLVVTDDVMLHTTSPTLTTIREALESVPDLAWFHHQFPATQGNTTIHNFCLKIFTAKQATPPSQEKK